MNAKISRLFVIIICVCAALGSVSCRTTKNLGGKTTADSEWHDLRVPVKVALRSPMNMSLSGRATMVRDSMVNISMRVFGMEVAVAHLTADSVFFVDKHNKYYFAEPLDALLGSHKMSVGRMQDIILGKGVDETLRFNNPGNADPVVVSFSDFVETLFGRLASDISIAVPVKDVDVKANLIWSLDDAKWNTRPTVKFTPPGNKYKRITASGLRSMFRSMM